MGIQSTTHLTREDAEKLYLKNYVERNEEAIKRLAKLLSDEELEQQLESTFDNYMIMPDEHFTKRPMDKNELNAKVEELKARYK